MRRMSFALTTPQYRAGTKTVTRRLGWPGLKPGDIVMGCVKCMGLGKGGVCETIHPFEVLSNRPERLGTMIDDPDYGRLEARLEGFPELDGPGFVAMFQRHMRVDQDHTVNRIHFLHRPDLLPVKPLDPAHP